MGLTVTNEENKIITEMREMRAVIEKAAARPRNGGGPSPIGVFGGEGPFDQNWSNDPNTWPVHKLKALDQAYGSRAAVDLFCRDRYGRSRTTGMGNMLLKMAAMSGQKDARESALAQGMSTDYNQDKFEEEYGCCSVQKAAKIGVPKWDWKSGKPILNERRKTALAENSGQTGGYIIPPQFMSELLTIAAEDGFVERLAKVVPMNSRTVQWPMLDITTVQATGVSPYFGGIAAYWQPEASTINEYEPGFKLTDWTAWDLVLLTISSNQLLADNGIGLDALLTSLFGQAITWFKEYAYFQGKGAGNSMPLGVLNAPATYAQTRTVSNRFTLADAAAMMAHLQARSWDNAVWVMHQSVLPQLIQMASGAVANTASTTYIPGNQLAWMNPQPSGDVGPAAMKLPTAFLNGRPIYFTEKLPQLGTKGDVMLVDWQRYVIGMRMDLQIDVSPHYKFANNQLTWRVIARADAKPWLSGAITDAAGWTVSPLVVLN